MVRLRPVWMTNHPPSVLWHCWLGHQTCKNRRPYNIYCVGADVKPCSINHLILRTSPHHSHHLRSQHLPQPFTSDSKLICYKSFPPQSFFLDYLRRSCTCTEISVHWRFFLATLARLRWTHSVFESTSVFVNSNFGNSNLLPFSRYWSLKLENSLVFPSFLVWCPLREEPVKFMDESNLAKNWGMELPCGGNFIIPNSTVFDWFTHVTDGQTYGRHITR